MYQNIVIIPFWIIKTEWFDNKQIIIQNITATASLDLNAKFSNIANPIIGFRQICRRPPANKAREYWPVL